MTHVEPVRRLLPWVSDDGKPCYVVGDGTGFVSRRADEVEATQLSMADELLGHAADLLGDRAATAPQVRFLAGCLVRALCDVCRVAESRGARLALLVSDEDGG